MEKSKIGALIGLFLVLVTPLTIAQEITSSVSYPISKAILDADTLASNTNVILGVAQTTTKPTQRIGESPSNRLDVERQQIVNYCKYSEGVICNLNKQGYLSDGSLIMRQYYVNQIPHYGLFKVVRGTERTACDGKDRDWNGVWQNGMFIGKTPALNCLRKTISYEQVSIGA